MSLSVCTVCNRSLEYIYLVYLKSHMCTCTDIDIDGIFTKLLLMHLVQFGHSVLQDQSPNLTTTVNFAPTLSPVSHPHPPVFLPWQAQNILSYSACYNRMVSGMIKTQSSKRKLVLLKPLAEDLLSNLLLVQI